MTFEDFMNQPPIDIFAMRSDSEPFKACAEANVAWRASDAKNLIWSSESIVETLKRCDKNVRYLSESSIKTYPTSNFIACLAKDAQIGMGLTPLICFDKTTNEYSLIDKGKPTRIEQSQIATLSKTNDWLRLYLLRGTKAISGKVIVEIIDRSSTSFDDFKAKAQATLADLIEAGHYCGYEYVTHEINSLKNGLIQFVIHFEPKYPEEKLEIPETLFHVTSAKLEDKIKRQGIVPKSKPSIINGSTIEHPDRVYVFLKYDDEAIRSFIKHKKIDDPIVISIKTSECRNLALYEDPMHSLAKDGTVVAAYTYDNISPKAITDIKHI